MSRKSDNIHIPLKESEALRLLLKVKPTDEMPRPGAAKKSVWAEVNDGPTSPKKRSKKTP